MTSSPKSILVEYVSPSGVACRRFADGPMLVRVACGQLDHDDGLLSEMERVRRGDEPVPFESRDLWEKALRAVACYRHLDEATRRRMREYVEFVGHLEG